MTFCNKGVVQANPPPPPVMVNDHMFTFFWDPSLKYVTKKIATTCVCVNESC